MFYLRYVIFIRLTYERPYQFKFGIENILRVTFYEKYPKS